MNKIVSLRSNIFYFKKKKEKKNELDTYLRQHEIIIVVEKTKYIHSDNGVIPQVCLEDMSFIIAQENFEELVGMLSTLGEIDESTIELNAKKAPKKATKKA